MPARIRRSVVGLTVVAITAATAAVAAAPAGAAPHSSSSCAAAITAMNAGSDAQDQRYTIVASSRQLRVFAPKRPGFGAYHYVCWTATGRVHRFARNSGGAASTDLVVTDVVAEGRYFAYRLAARGTVDEDRFRVVDGRSGRVVRDSGPVRVPANDQPLPHQLALFPGQLIAWADTTGVHLTDGRGTRVLSDGATGVPTQLERAGRSLTWSQGGTQHRALVA